MEVQVVNWLIFHAFDTAYPLAASGRVLLCNNTAVCQILIVSHAGRGIVNEYSCVCLHGDRRPQERKNNLQAFKNGDIRFLICTDVAARGIDVQGIPFGN